MSETAQFCYLGGEKMKNYIISGRIAREEIASDICDGTLTREDVNRLIGDPRIKSSFIGSSFEKKIDKKGWNKEYLNRLPNYAIAESFNEDYLYYLLDVREYVSLQKTKVATLISSHKYLCIIIGLVIVAGIVAIILSQNTTPPSVEQIVP